VEEAPCRELYAHPLHPYSEALIKSIPMADPRNRKRRYALQGDVPDPSKPPPGCVFSSRCAYCLPLCKEMEPPLTAGGEGRAVACHRSRELNLLGFLDKGEKRQWLGALSQKIWKGMPG
jgi:peptide/nickel transport system ATP-binding protein